MSFEAFDLTGKVALVTGAGSGIGRASALALQRNGYHVVLAGRRSEELDKTAEQAASGGGKMLAVPTDVGDPASVVALFAKAKETFGRLDILFNNAGVSHPMQVEQISESIWDKELAVHAKGVFLGAQSVVEAMRNSGGGSIVNISSTAGIRASLSTHYGASKGAVRLLSKSIAVHHARDGIRCNSVHPGPVATQMGFEAVPESVRSERLSRIPLGRFAQPEEIARTALFLASDESSFTSGADHFVDGGYAAI